IPHLPRPRTAGRGTGLFRRELPPAPARQGRLRPRQRVPLPPIASATPPLIRVRGRRIGEWQETVPRDGPVPTSYCLPALIGCPAWPPDRRLQPAYPPAGAPAAASATR